MANVKISGLPTASTPLTGAELVPVVQSGVTSQTTVDAFNYFKQDGTSAVPTTVQAKLRETVSIKDFGAVGDGVTDDTAAFNKAITAAALLGGGKVTAPAGTYKIAGTIILVTNIHLHLPGVTLSGNGSNTIFETGTLVGSSTVSNIYTYAPPLGFDGLKFCYNTVLDGVTINNCYIGARLQRFNDGCEIRNCFISASYRAILSTNGWNQRFVLNKFYQTVQLNDFVDWTVVESNAFESITSNAALLIGANQLGQQLVSITQGSNSTAYGLASVSSGGAVTSITILNGGSGYTAGAVTVAAHYGTGPGSGTTGTVTVSSGAVTAFTLVSGGSSYTPPEATYGGSWTCRVSSNGFHFCGVGIMTQVQVEGLQILGNHFESSKRHIWQNSTNTCQRWKVHNNHLAAQVSNVTAFEMYALLNSDIRFNDFVASGGGSFTKYVVLNSTNTFGNKVQYPFDPSPTAGEPDRSMYTLADTNLLEYMAGSNNPAFTIPVLENYSGANSYTYEKYRAVYPVINNLIPFCTVSDNGAGTFYVDTFVNCSAYGTDQPVLFNVKIGGATTYACMGFVGSFDVLTIVNKEYYSGGAGLTITAQQTAANSSTLSTVNIIGTGGQFSCASANLTVGMTVTISGTFGGTGSIIGYSNPTTYYIIATNGTTTFTLSATNGGSAITTTAGTPTGLTYTIGNGSKLRLAFAGAATVSNVTGFIKAI